MLTLFPRSTAVALVVLCLEAPAGVAQEHRTVFIAPHALVVPNFHSFGLSTHVRVWAGVSVVASIRQVRGFFVCIESSPSPCNPDGQSLGLGVRLTAESAGSWWPYLEVTGGRHHYSFSQKWFPFAGVGAGIGWYVGNRGALRVGLEYATIPADPPTLPEWRREGATYDHTVAGFLVGFAIAVG